MRTFLSFLTFASIPSILFSATEIPQGIAKLQELRVNSTSEINHTKSIVATDQSDNFYVVWGDGNDVFYSRFDINGSPITVEQRVTDIYAIPDLGLAGPYITVNDDNDFLITWLDNRNPDGLPGRVHEIYGTMFSSYGTPFDNIDNVRFSSAPFRDPFNPQSEEIGNYVPFIEVFEVVSYKGPEGSFVIPWGDDDEGVAPPDCKDLEDQLVGFFDPYNIATVILEDISLVDNNGFPEGIDCDTPQDGKEVSGSGAVGIDSRNHLIFAFQESEVIGHDLDIYLQRFNQNGIPTGPEKFVVYSRSEDQIHPDIVVNSLDEYFISFINDQSGTNDSLFCIKFNSSDLDPAPIDTIFANVISDVALVGRRKNSGIFTGANNDYLILVWEGAVGNERDVYARIYYSDANGKLIALHDEEFTKIR